MSAPKRRPVRTLTHNEDDTLRLAQLLARIERRASAYLAREIVRRAFAFNGTFIKPIKNEDAQ